MQKVTILWSFNLLGTCLPTCFERFLVLSRILPCILSEIRNVACRIRIVLVHNLKLSLSFTSNFEFSSLLWSVEIGQHLVGNFEFSNEVSCKTWKCLSLKIWSHPLSLKIESGQHLVQVLKYSRILLSYEDLNLAS